MLRFLRNGLLLLLLLSGTKIFAGDFNGVVTKLDVIVSPAANALVEVREGSKPTVSMRTNVDGTYRFPLIKSTSYIVKISSKTFADTLFTFTTDKSAKPSAPQNMVVKLKRHGIYLTGSVRSMAEFFPIKEAVVVLKNVMTREEKRVMTGADGVYNFKLEYESNYRLSVDKRSTGIFNRYRDTSLYLSTIGLDQPMEYWLNLRLDEDKQKTTEGIEGYDPMRVSGTIKPGIDVVNKTYKKSSPNYLEGAEPAPAKTVPQSQQEVKIDTARKSAALVFEEIKKDTTVVAIPVKTLPTTKPVESKPAKAQAQKMDSAIIKASKERVLKEEQAKKAEQEKLAKELAKNELIKAKEEAKRKEEEMAAKANAAKKDSLKTAEVIKETGKEKQVIKEEPVKTKAEIRKAEEAAKAVREKAVKDSILITEWIKESKREQAKKAEEEALAKAKAAKRDSIKAAEVTLRESKKAKPAKKDSSVVVAPIKESKKEVPVTKADPAKTKEELKKEEEDRILKEKTAKKMAEEMKEKAKTEKKLEEERAAKAEAAKRDSIKAAEVAAKEKKKAKPAKEEPVQPKFVQPEKTKKQKPAKEAEVKTAPAKTDSIALDKKSKAKEEAKPAKQEPAKPVLASTRSVADIKADIKAAEKNLDDITKQEKEILKAAEYEKKQKAKNKGVDVVVITDGPKITPAQIAAQKMAATLKLEDLKAELERAKGEKK